MQLLLSNSGKILIWHSRWRLKGAIKMNIPVSCNQTPSNADNTQQSFQDEIMHHNFFIQEKLMNEAWLLFRFSLCFCIGWYLFTSCSTAVCGIFYYRKIDFRVQIRYIFENLMGLAHLHVSIRFCPVYLFLGHISLYEVK